MNEWPGLDERNGVLWSRKKGAYEDLPYESLDSTHQRLAVWQEIKGQTGDTESSLPSVWFEPVEKTIFSLGIDRSAVTPDSSEVDDVHLQSSSPI